MKKRIELLKLVETTNDNILRHMLYTLLSTCSDSSIAFFYKEMDYVFSCIRKIDSVK